MIPKIIHYCWFGGNDKPIIFDKCLESWKKYAPDAMIIEWNEDNIDLNYNKFLSNAYKNKKYAFVSDVVRLLVVYNMGGIYLDTDVELFDPLDDLYENKAFFIFQNHDQINTGLMFGAQKGNSIVKRLLDDYTELVFDIKKINQLTCPIRNTLVLKETIQFENNKTENINGIQFLSFEDYCKRAHHYGEFSWMDEKQKIAMKYAKKEHKYWKFRKIARNQKIFVFFERHHFFTIQKVYTFLVYDFIDYGLRYWIYRIKQKLEFYIKSKI